MRVSSNFVSVARRLTLAGTAAVVGISIYARDPANDLQASTDESAATELTPGKNAFSEKTRMRLRDVRAEPVLDSCRCASRCSNTWQAAWASPLHAALIKLIVLRRPDGCFLADARRHACRDIHGGLVYCAGSWHRSCRNAQ